MRSHTALSRWSARSATLYLARLRPILGFKVGHMIQKRDPLRPGSSDDLHQSSRTVTRPCTVPRAGPAARSTPDRSTRGGSACSTNTPAVVVVTTANVPACRAHQPATGWAPRLRSWSRGWRRSHSGARADLVGRVPDPAPYKASRRGCRRRSSVLTQPAWSGRPCRRRRARRRGAVALRHSVLRFV